MMDCSDTATGGTGGDTCTGQWGGSGPPNTPIPKVNKPLGQEWTVETFDPEAAGRDTDLWPSRNARRDGDTAIADRDVRTRDHRPDSVAR